MHRVILKYIVGEVALYVLFKVIADNCIKPYYMECKRVRVKERKLNAKWTLEPQQDIISVPGPDFRAEMMKHIREEIENELKMDGNTIYV